MLFHLDSTKKNKGKTDAYRKLFQNCDIFVRTLFNKHSFKEISLTRELKLRFTFKRLNFLFEKVQVKELNYDQVIQIKKRHRLVLHQLIIHFP